VGEELIHFSDEQCMFSVSRFPLHTLFFERTHCLPMPGK